MVEANSANVLGVAVSPINMGLALERISQAIASRQKGYVCVTGVHGVSEAQSDAEFRQILNSAFLCTPDGMPLVWVGRWQGQKQMDRVYGPDLMLAVMELSEKTGWRHFLYGGANGTAKALQTKLLERFPKAQIVGAGEPPFRPLNADEQIKLREDIGAARPDILWVGLSTPKQERFMTRIFGSIGCDADVWSGGGLRFPGRQSPAGTPVDAAFGVGVVLPACLRAAAAVETLF